MDNLNAYYDPLLKQDRLKQLAKYHRFEFERVDLSDAAATGAIVDKGPFDATVHLAAQAGVRYSQEAPRSYTASNVAGLLNVLEGCRAYDDHYLVFASSSSVYGDCTAFPVRETADTTRPVSLYAATKMAGELMAHSYADQYGLAVSALRLFTVYGPWGRPDMAIFKFTDAIFANEPVELYAGGTLQRDFTYVDDIAQGIVAAIDHPPSTDQARFRAYNLGRGMPVMVTDLLEELERCLGRRAVRRFLPPQIGDVSVTCADISAAQEDLGYQPATSICQGLRHFIDWYRGYYHLNKALRYTA